MLDHPEFERWAKAWTNKTMRLNLIESEFFRRWKYCHKMKIHRMRYPDKVRAQVRDSYRRHKEQRREYARNARVRMKSSPDLLNKYRRYCRTKAAIRCSTDLNFLIRKKLRTRINMALNRTDAGKKSMSTIALVGCSIDELKRHIESQWQSGMNWGNYGRGGWHIDHIKPCISFDLSNPEEQLLCFNYRNLQPLWEKDNLSKGPKC